MRIFLNDRFVDEEEARIDIFDPGFLYGQGVFETMRAYNEKVFRLDSHIQRLLNSLLILNIKLGLGANTLKRTIKQCVRENNLKSAYLRLTVWQGREKANIAVFAGEYNFLSEESYRKGFKAMLCRSFTQNEFSPLSNIKSANYLNLLLAYQDAKKNNFDEALLLNTGGFLAEASRANIFLVKDNSLLTPSLDCGCLPGITRDTVLDIARREKIKISECRLKPRDLERCDEAFLTNSLIEVMPLVCIQDRAINKGSPGEITELFLKRYRLLT